jgi:lipopolysaccharide export LptBFGC system permease protein LptF
VAILQRGRGNDQTALDFSAGSEFPIFGLLITRGAKMGSHYSKTFVLAVVALGMALSLVGSAFAQAGPVSVPAPLIGAGLPALAILGGGYWLVRKLRQRR